MHHAVSSRWATRRAEKARRLACVASLTRGRLLPAEHIVEALEALLVPGDRVALEGENQKQADFLSRSLAQVNPHVIHDLHLRVREHQPSRALGSFRARHCTPH